MAGMGRDEDGAIDLFSELSGWPTDDAEYACLAVKVRRQHSRLLNSLKFVSRFDSGSTGSMMILRSQLGIFQNASFVDFQKTEPQAFSHSIEGG